MQFLGSRSIRILAIFAILAISLSAVALPAIAAPADDLIITGVIDGPLPGGLPKAIELYAINNIPDLSVYGLGSANNGGGTNGEEFSFPVAVATAGNYIYVASEATEFSNWFGFAPDYTSSAANINGDDAIELFTNGTVTDLFGDINVDGTGQPWEYMDGWAYRKNATGPDGTTFVLGNWSFSAPNALDGETSNANAAFPFPSLTYSTVPPVDTAPNVSSTTPADAAIDVPVDSDITINFSEDVSVTGAWFDISCSSSLGHTATVSGGPQSYTLNPDMDFETDESCTVSVIAAQVADVDTDDPPDNMSVDFVFSFTTTAGTPPSASPGDVIINEIMQNPDAVFDDMGEWFELFNTTASDIDISGWTIRDNDTDIHVLNNGDPLIIPGGGYLVLGNNANPSMNGGANVNYSYGSDWFLANGADEVILVAPDATEIDRVEYDDGATFPDPTGASMALIDPALDNNVGANWCTSSTPYGNGDKGTPGATNSCAPPPPPAVVISEIRIDQPSTDNDEFFELAGDPGTLLDGLTYLVIGDGTGGSGVIEAVVDLSGQSIPASGFFVAAEGTFSLGTADLTVSLNFENGDNVTHLLVAGFSGSNGDDLDTNDDGALDLTPWTDLLDLIALVEEDNPPTGTEFHYGPPSVGPDGSFVPGHASLCPAGWEVGSFSTGVDDTPGAANSCAPPPPPGGFCGDPATMIYEIQGSGLSSPLAGSVLVIEGVVVGDFQQGFELNGFFVQEEDADSDADPATSDGIFVFAPGAIDVLVGDVVRVQGAVSEFFGLTQLGSVSSLTKCETAGVASTASVALPVSSLDDLERFEGMAVTIPQTLFISEFFNFDRFGEIVLSTDRQFQPTAVFEPGSPEAADLALANSLSRITLDDGRSNQNPDPAIHPNGGVFDLDNLFRGGDQVANVTGVMHYSFGLYRIQPTQGADFTPDNTRPALPDEVGGNLSVASFNVLNYFTTLDDSGPICGPLGDQGCRGADNAEEFTRQRDKIITAIVAMDADIVGLMEIENHVSDDAVADLVSGLNAVAGAGTYAAISTGPIGSDAIKVGLIYQPATVTPVGDFAVLDSSVDPTFNDEKNRPALAQTFEEVATGASFTVVVNHLKSKGSSCDDVGDPDTGDGQGNCNLTRTAAAAAEAAWLATDPTGSGDPDFLIIGDLNAYDKEDPIDALQAGGFTDLLSHLIGEFAYSYVFSGELGYLDHALANADLLDEITGVTVWHINADEPDLIDYDTSFKQDAQDALYAPDAYRSSDHDPVIVGLSLEIPPIAEVSDFVVLADQSAFLQYRTQVKSGDVGANNASSGPFVFYHDEVVLSYKVKMLDPSSRVLGDDVRLQYGAKAYDVYYNDLVNQGSILGTQFNPLNLPLVSAMPDVPSFTAGTQNVIVGVKQTVTLAPGEYGRLYAFRGSTVVLSGGEYTFENWLVGRDADIVFEAASTVLIEDRLYTSKKVYIGPASGSGLSAADIRIIATGANGNSGKLHDWPKTIFIGYRNKVVANLYAPNGLLWIFSRSQGTGAFIGEWVLIGDRVKLTHESGW